MELHNLEGHKFPFWDYCSHAAGGSVFCLSLWLWIMCKSVNSLLNNFYTFCAFILFLVTQLALQEANKAFPTASFFFFFFWNLVSVQNIMENVWPINNRKKKIKKRWSKDFYFSPTLGRETQMFCSQETILWNSLQIQIIFHLSQRGHLLFDSVLEESS